MKHYLSIVFLFFLLLFAACDPAAELGTPFHKGQEVVLTAAIGEQCPQMMPGMQRISGKDAGNQINFVWDNEDRILVKVAKETSIFTLTSGAGTGDGAFSGFMPADGSSFDVEYPVNYNDDVLNEQTYVENGIAKGLMKMSTSSPGTLDKGFTLSAEHAVLGLQLTGSSEIGKIVLTKNDADGKAAQPSYTLNCPGVKLTNSPTLFYIVLPAGTWEYGFTVSVYGADKTTVIESLVTKNRFTFESTSATIMAEQEVTMPKPEYVDLGLSVKWATFNVGASKPEDYGDYFAWGETEPKEEYSWVNYKWFDGTDANMTKYNATDGKTILEPEDDAAHVHWGDKWRMPRKEEQQELIDRCSWERITLNGVVGYKVSGPNGNSIFIPIAGAYNSFDNQINSVGSIGWIYSSTAATEQRAYEIHIEEGCIQQKNCSRCVGLTIRPVYDDVEKHYRNGITQANWDAATSSWGHGGRGHAPTNQSCIQGTIVHGIRLKIVKKGSLDVYKVPSLLEKTEDNFELVAILTTDSTGVQDFDFDQPIYIAPNEYLVFGKPSAKAPTLLPCFINNTVDDSFPDAIKGLTHFIGSEKVASSSNNASLMVEFY